MSKIASRSDKSLLHFCKGYNLASVMQPGTSSKQLVQFAVYSKC